MQRLGIKTHWRDVERSAALADKHGASVLEYQMLPGDLERHAQRAFDAFLPYRGRFELRVHQPEGYLDEGGRPVFLDISSPDPALRARSVERLGECARFAMELRAKALVIHPGGIWREGEVGGSPELLRESLQDVPKHVKLLLENMPEIINTERLGVPSGYSPAAFRIPAGLKLVDDLVDGFVLDISHAFLAVPRGSEAVVRAFARELGTRITHVHAAGSRARPRADAATDASSTAGSRARPRADAATDASSAAGSRASVGESGEGTPFSDSDYGAELVREVLAAVSREAVVVPEIMDGHVGDMRLFDEGLAFLRPLLSR